MDYDKANRQVGDFLDKVEGKTVDTFKSQSNFVRNLRKFITNEQKHFEEIILTKALHLTAIFIGIDCVLKLLGKDTILGTLPKVVTFIILYLYKSFVMKEENK